MGYNMKLDKELILRRFVQIKVPNATEYFVDWGRDSLFVQTSDKNVSYDFKVSEIINATIDAIKKMRGKLK